MDRDDLLELITIEDTIKILRDLGSESYIVDNQGNLYFLNVCHNGNSYKLHYFIDSKMFRCYTCCGTLSLYDVIMSALNIDFQDAFKYICELKNISVYKEKRLGLQKKETVNKDLDFLKLHLYKKTKPIINLPSYDKSILRVFDGYMPTSWYAEGITQEIANFYDIKLYFTQQKCVIPHYDINGVLVGIRARSFSTVDIKNKRKYMPITVQGLTYRYPMNLNIYGIYQNKNSIVQFKKAILFESEKSVMLYGSYYGQKNNISLATCGMTVSLYQRDLLISLGIEEVIVAFDKQYQVDQIEVKYKGTREWKEYEEYIKRLIKITNIFESYCKVSVISCWDERIAYKDAPIDKGKQTFEDLYRERYLINDIEELKEMIS